MWAALRTLSVRFSFGIMQILAELQRGLGGKHGDSVLPEKSMRSGVLFDETLNHSCRSEDAKIGCGAFRVE